MNFKGLRGPNVAILNKKQVFYSKSFKIFRKASGLAIGRVPMAPSTRDPS
jgi:hypothetical protein